MTSNRIIYLHNEKLDIWKLERDEEREERIEMEAIADAYDSEEQAMGWYYYLKDKITFPFKAQLRKFCPLEVI